MKKVITFGEIMLRLSTPNALRFAQSASFNADYGGGEFNVAASLSNFGISTEFVTRIPDNDIGKAAMQQIKKHGVGTEHIEFGGDRLGIYFLELGADVRGGKVVYDRANSSISQIKIGEIDWKSVFKDAQWFHWSGVTPAISQSAAEVCLEAVKAAFKMGLTVSSDLNYRSKLWKYNKEPQEVMPELLKYCHVMLGDLDTTMFMLGMDKMNPDYQKTTSLPNLYDQIITECPNLKTIATTLRYSVNASHQKIGGILYDGTKIYGTKLRELTSVVDRVGSGDAFMGGLIYSLLDKKNDPQKCIDFATAACCLKHTIRGDVNSASLEEIQNLAWGDSDGSVNR